MNGLRAPSQTLRAENGPPQNPEPLRVSASLSWPAAQVNSELESKAPREPAAAEASPAAPAGNAAAAAPADDPMESEDGPAAEAAPLLPSGVLRSPLLPRSCLNPVGTHHCARVQEPSLRVRTLPRGQKRLLHSCAAC
jgi:hypothetical protein